MEVAELIERADMVEYVSQYVDLEEKNGEYWGLSPWQAEKTPSFSVRPETKVFCDFSSGRRGNFIQFIMDYHGVSVAEAVRMLKKFVGVSEDEDVVYRSSMAATKVAKKYRQQKKKDIQQHAKALEPGFMSRYIFDSEKLKPWEDEGIDMEVMYKRGVKYDPFDNRIVYPIYDYDGRLICVSGRTCDPDYKSKGIRKYTYMQSIGTLDTIYGVSERMSYIVDKHELILFEGCKSVLKAESWGIMNCGALLTSHVSDSQLRFLIRLASFHHVRIVFALDSDVDIRKDMNIKKLRSYANVEWVMNRSNLLQDKESPVDRGKEVFEKLYERRESLHG